MTIRTFDDWDSVMAFALTLPGAEPSMSWGAPTVRIGGRPIVYPGRELDSFVVASPHHEKEVLIETDPDTFWQTDHYRNWPALLVRFGSPDGDRIETVIRRAWWDRLTKSQHKDFGPRP